MKIREFHEVLLRTIPDSWTLEIEIRELSQRTLVPAVDLLSEFSLALEKKRMNKMENEANQEYVATTEQLSSICRCRPVSRDGIEKLINSTLRTQLRAEERKSLTTFVTNMFSHQVPLVHIFPPTRHGGDTDEEYGLH